MAEGLSLVVVGVSRRPVCGVRDHARLLSEALGERGIACSTHWLAGREGPRRTVRAQTRVWLRGLSVELEEAQPHAILLHYSVFALSHRGLPLSVHPTLAALRRTRVPVLGMLHELAFPWGHRGWRGDLWALTHRAVLVELMGLCAAAVVTADFRAEWLASRRWLPRRPLAVAPVFSNLPVPTARPAGRRPPVLGLFGYSEAAAAEPVTEALRLLERRGTPAQLTLLGAPGGSAPAGRAWSEAAQARGVGDALSFSGTLPPQELSDALAACDVLLYADTAGPVSRKGTLAASLASGRPVVALDGSRRWSELIDAGALRLVPRAPRPLADAIGDLLADEREREALGGRGRAFAQRRMSVAHSADVVAGLARRVSGRYEGALQARAADAAALQCERAVR